MTECNEGLLDNECGVFGSCVAGLCVCDKPWTQSRDFVFNDQDLGVQICDTHETLIGLIYGLLLAGAAFLIFFHLVFVKKLSQIRRLIPLLMTYIGFFVLAVIKLRNNNLAVFRDASVTILLFGSIFAGNCSSLVFFQKYIHFQQNLVQLKPNVTLLIKQAVRFQRYGFGFDLTTATLFITPLFTSPDVGELLVRIGLFLGAIRATYAGKNAIYLITLLLRDISLTADMTNADEYAGLLKKRSSTLRNVRLHVVWFNIYVAVVFLIGAIFPAFIPTFKYLVPIMYLLSFLMSLLVLINYQKARLLRFTRKAKHMKSSKSSFIVVNPDRSYSTTPGSKFSLKQG